MAADAQTPALDASEHWAPDRLPNPIRASQTGPDAAAEVKAMTKLIYKMTLGLGLMALAAGQVSAQNARNCGPREAVVERLAGKYGETRQSIGLGANNAVVEVFASQETGTWTITVTMPTGVTCLVASGQSFESLAEALPPQGNDA